MHVLHLHSLWVRMQRGHDLGVFADVFLCFLRLLDKHVWQRSSERNREKKKREGAGGTGDIRESFLDLTQTTGSDRMVTSAQALLRMED